MKLIFALGNPEPRYAGTRHNVGCAVADMLASEWGSDFHAKPKLKAELAEHHRSGEKILIAKPTTYYNHVGESYRLLADFYKIAPEDTLVIADDLALDFGTIRTRVGGSGGGSNGIKSLNAHGGEATLRLRIGIANELRQRMGDADFVLGQLSTDETAALRELHPKFVQIINEFIAGMLSATTHRHSS